MRMSVLFVLVVGSLAGCGSPPDLPGPRDTVAKWVISKGGRVVVSGKPEELKSVAEMPAGDYRVEKIILNETRIADADLSQLRDLKHLRSLSLYRTRIGDAAMSDIAQIPSLQELELSYTGITDEGLKKLAALKNLRKLFLRGTEQHVQAPAIKSLQEQLPNLEVFR